MSAQELLTFLPMWRNPRDVMENIIEEYDLQFGIVELLDRNGQFITAL